MTRLVPVFILCLLSGLIGFSKGVESSDSDLLAVDAYVSFPSVSDSGNTLNPRSAVCPGPLVSVLLNPACPAAVAWGVSCTVVDSVDAAALWSRSHIGIEFIEVSPPFTDGYSSRTVFLEGRHVWIIAPIHHGDPRSIFSAARHPVGDTVVYNAFSHVDSPLINVVRGGGVGAPSAHYNYSRRVV